MSDASINNNMEGASSSSHRLSEIENQQRAMFEALITIQQQLSSNIPSSSANPFAQNLPPNQTRTSSGQTPSSEEPQVSSVSYVPKKLAPWPSWKGQSETFSLFIFQLRLKIENERPYLGEDQMVCYNMLQALPEDKRLRVGQWFTTGGERKNWDWRGFLQHIQDQFEDKQAKQNAGDKLARIRMGDAQFFTDYLQDFEYLLAQCDGLKWDASVKIIHLNNSINTTLRKALISKTMPDDDYERWVRKARNVASRVENEPDYRPKGSTRTKSWTLAQKGARLRTPVLDGPPPIQLDADGDTPMANANTVSLNQLVAALQQAANLGKERVGNDPKSSLPRATWKSQSKVERLRSGRKCISCEQKGHISANCPSFRPAIPPSRTNAGVHRLGTQPSDDDQAEHSEESDSGKDEP